MSKVSLPKIGASRSRPSVSRSRSENNGQSAESRGPGEATTKEDVIRTFFNQILEFAIEDMVVFDPVEKGTVENEEGESDLVVKEFTELEREDLEGGQVVAVTGSKVSLRKNASGRNRSRLSAIEEENTEMKSSTVSTTFSNTFLDEERSARITFVTGNTYEGTIRQRVMNGKGVYRWSDGTVYEGEFLDGFPTGKGEMVLPDLSRYVGGFKHGLFDGEGFLNVVSTPTFYSGQWRNGLRHGNGWLLYEPGDWYDGGWREDLKDGFGVRFYKNGAKYRGGWKEGLYDGEGLMIWQNNDYYKGEWKEGLMDGQGEYVWRTVFNDTFTFPIQNVYRGGWSQGKRWGEGLMKFGTDCGSRLVGSWRNDFKDGDGLLICGNGQVVQRANLFYSDKLQRETETASGCGVLPDELMEVSIFTIHEEVDVACYIDKVLERLTGVSAEKLEEVRAFEARCVTHTILLFLPQLNELYRKYTTIYAKKKVDHQLIMVRMFLWQLYRDVEIYKLGLSLVDTDRILSENPRSTVDTVHYPFEPIYYWQFLMSLVGVALTTCSWEDEYEVAPGTGVCASVIKRFFRETLFGKSEGCGNSMVASYLDLVPIKSVYELYRSLGEPHTARTFLQHACTRKGEEPFECHVDLFSKESDPKLGKNVVLLTEYVTFLKKKGSLFSSHREPLLKEEGRHHWSSLYNLRPLGAKNIVRCLSSVCPFIYEQGLLVNMDYELTFLEFYETLLTCIFMVLELEMKKEKKILEQSLPDTQPKKKQSSKLAIKKPGKGEKKGGKKK